MHCHVFTVIIATAGEQYAAYQHDSTVFGAGSPWWTTSGGAKGVYCACTEDRTHFLWVGQPLYRSRGRHETTDVLIKVLAI